MSNRVSARRLARDYLLPVRGWLVALAVLLVSSTALPLALPQFVRAFLDGAARNDPVASLVAIAVAYLATAVLLAVADVTATWIGEQMAWRATNNLRADLVDHSLRLDLPFHNETPPGALIERVDGDVTALSTVFSRFAVDVVGSALYLVGVTVLVWREDALIGMVLVAFVGIVLVALHRLRSLAVEPVAAAREASAAMFGTLEERLAGLDDIRSNGAGAHVVERFADVASRWVDREAKGEQATATAFVSIRALFIAAYAAILAAGAWRHGQGAMTIGTVYLLFMYLQQLREPLEQIADQFRELQTAAGSLRRIGQLLDTHPIVVDGPPAPDADIGARLPVGALSVQLRGVRFAYPDGGRMDDVLSGIDLDVPAGSFVGVIGRTGSGKTTLGRLLARLYDPVEGSVLLGGVDVRSVPLATLRHALAVVPQDVQLFRASVRDNVTLFGSAAISDDRLAGILDDLELGPWLRSLPHGLDSELADNISAGEAQLLAFARAFARDPGLVVLDEASSRVDPVTEARIQRAVDRLVTGRTAVVIAHRLSTLERADRIVLLEGGRVIEDGERVTLAADAASRYAALRRAGLDEVLA